VERGEDSDHSHFAVIELSLEGCFVVGLFLASVVRRCRSLRQMKPTFVGCCIAGGEEASTWLWPVNVGAYVD
jgi:hypothetical protein